MIPKVPDRVPTGPNLSATQSKTDPTGFPPRQIRRPGSLISSKLSQIKHRWDPTKPNIEVRGSKMTPRRLWQVALEEEALPATPKGAKVLLQMEQLEPKGAQEATESYSGLRFSHIRALPEGGSGVAEGGRIASSGASEGAMAFFHRTCRATQQFCNTIQDAKAILHRHFQ